MRVPSSSGASLASGLLAVLIALTSSGLAAETPIDFATDVEPIFLSRCLKCHGPDQQQSGLRVDQRASLLRGGDFGKPSIVAGDSDESFLLLVVSGDDPDLRMPPEGELLMADQIEILRQWIQQGAAWPGQMSDSADAVTSDHWSLQPIGMDGPSGVDGPSGGPGFSDRVDTMITEKLQQHGLSFSPPADPATLLRRVTLVLTGLPPTPEDAQRFLDDPDGVDVAYTRAVDRLLQSPRYGERWAQHWLDVIRWAETVGFETNLARANAWPYRDWLIQSLNEDKPYDRFIYEQVAGDMVGQDAALGFLVSGPANLPGQIGRDEEAMRQARQDELDEVIRTVSQGFFGLTVTCARCHNHKFDPILQRDYYSMQAIFAGLTYGERRLRGELNDRWTARVPEVRSRLERLRAQLETMRQKQGLRPPLGDVHTETFSPITARAVRMEILATDNGGPASLYELQVFSRESEGTQPRNVALAALGATPSASSFALANQTRHFDNLIDGSVDRRQAFPWVSAAAGAAWVQIDFPRPGEIDRVVWERGGNTPAVYEIKVLDEAGQWQSVANASDRLPRQSDTRSADKVELHGVSADAVAEIVTKIADVRSARAELDRLSAGPQVFAARFSDSPEPTWLLYRGDPMQRREIVPPAIPRVLGGLGLGDLGLDVDAPEPQRRRALAEHLTNPAHPLTARVIVNRIWQHHFGAGLVDSPSDFGKMGRKPSHPELLDTLASQFVADGWSLKQLHRHIVLSRTFRQSSTPRASALQIDAESRLLWRFPPRRLEAEAIRDSILYVSGKLNLQMGGPGFNLFHQRGGLSDYTAIETFDETGWRRMIYAHKIRMQEVDTFGAFDCPDAGQMKPKRTRSITPTQSLSLFNSPMVLRQAGFFADRLHREAGDMAEAQISRAFEIVFSRLPTDDERARLSEFVKDQGLEQLCRVLMNTSEFLYIQ